MGKKLSKERIIISTIFLGLLISTIPLLLVTMPPLADLPNHLARFHILREIDNNAFFQLYYTTNWSSVPNLISDILITFVGSQIPIMIAGKLIVFLYFILSITGVVLLSHANFKKISTLSLLAFLILYNSLLILGLLNYLLGSALLVIGLAVWCKVREKRWLITVLCSSIVCISIYYSHLFPFGLYLVAIAVYEIQSFFFNGQIEWNKFLPKFIRAIVQFIAPIVLFFFFSPMTEGTSFIKYGDFFIRISQLWYLPFDNYDKLIDRISFILFAGILIIGFAKRWIAIAPSMWGIIGTFTIVHFASPQYLMSSPGGNIRTLIPLIMIILGSIRLTGNNPTYKQIVVGVMLPLFLVRITVISYNWMWSDKSVYSEYQQAFTHLPEGAKVGNLYLNNSHTNIPNPPHSHYVTLAAIEKSAFVPRLYAHKSQQPISFSKDYKEIARLSPADHLNYLNDSNTLLIDPQDESSPFFKNRFQHIDYFIYSNIDGKKRPLPEFLIPIYQGKYVQLYEVNIN